MLASLSAVATLSENLQANADSRESVAQLMASQLTPSQKESFLEDLLSAILQEDGKLVNDLSATIAVLILEDLRTAKILDSSEEIRTACGKLQLLSAREPEREVPLSRLFARLASALGPASMAELLLPEAATDVKDVQFASAAMGEVFSRESPAKEEVAADLRRRVLVDLPDMSPEVREVFYCRILPLIETPEFIRAARVHQRKP